MITGEINVDRMAVVHASIKAAGVKAGSHEAVVFTIDTGFNGYLSLPLVLIEAMELPFINYQWFNLAGDTKQRFPVHAAIITWDGEERGVLALASDGSPTIGTELLYGYQFFADWVDGGAVTISARQ